MDMMQRLKTQRASAWCSWMVAGALLLSSATGYAAKNTLNSVTVTQGKNDTQVVKMSFKETVDATPATFTTSNPHRLVLDFADTGNAIGRITENLNTGVIKNYQVVQAGDRTRLVLNLTGPANYELQKERNTLVAVLHGVTKQQGAEQAPVHFAETGAQSEYSIRDVDFHRGKNGEGMISVSLSNPGVGIDIQQKGHTLQVDFINTSLPRSLQRRLDVADFATPAQLIETFEQGKVTRMVVTPKGKWDYSAYQTGNQFIMELRSLENLQVAQGEKPVYTGEKLSLNFQNVEVRSVLQVIADFTGLNIVASDTVTGNLTLRLKDVPWDQALDIILRAKGLDKRTSGNVIWIAPRDELAAKEKMELEAKKAVQELEPLVTRSYPLNYIRADEASAVLSGLSRVSRSSTDQDATCSPSSTGIKAENTTGGNGSNQDLNSANRRGGQNSSVNRVLSDRGGVSHDLTTNTLVVTDTLERQAAVEEVLKSVDLPTKQVMIEARIVLADDSFSKDLGARLGVRVSGKLDGHPYGFGGTLNDSLNVALNGAQSATTPNVDLPTSTTAPSIGFTILNAGTNKLLSLELQALETDNRGKIVSNPRVVTTNLRPAVILQGTQIPYQTQSAVGSPPTISFKDALLCLLVSPQVLNNDSIILNVEVQKDAVGANTVNAGPAINVKRVKTQVRVNNGETAILGGIFEQTLRNDTDKVPFLGDLPILGNLFKTNHKVDEKSEMLIFLTPRVLDERLSELH